MTTKRNNVRALELLENNLQLAEGELGVLVVKDVELLELLVELGDGLEGGLTLGGGGLDAVDLVDLLLEIALGLELIAEALGPRDKLVGLLCKLDAEGLLLPLELGKLGGETFLLPLAGKEVVEQVLLVGKNGLRLAKKKCELLDGELGVDVVKDAGLDQLGVDLVDLLELGRALRRQLGLNKKINIFFFI